MKGKRMAGAVLLALLLLGAALPGAQAAPDQPQLTVTHTAGNNRVLLELTARIPAATGEDEPADWQTGLTLSVQMAESLTVDAASIQAVYQKEDGESYTLDRGYWDAKGRQVLLGLSTEGDQGGQLLCRLTADASSGALRGKMVNTAQLTLEYTDLITGEVIRTTADARDEETFGQSLTLDPAGGVLANQTGGYLWQEDLLTGQQVNLADLPRPSREGYLFDGWTLATAGGGRIESGSLIMGEGDAVLRADWLSKEDKLTLDLNGGSGRVVTVGGRIDEDVTVPDPSTVLYSRDGYKLAGWTDTPDGNGGKRYSGGEPYRLTREDDVLYAWWAPMYTVTYDANGGTGQMPRRIFASSDELEIEKCLFQRQDYSFAGWSLAADGRGSWFKEGDKLTLSENITLYAQWEKIYESTDDGKDEGTGILIAVLIAAVAAVCVVVLILALRRRRKDQEAADWEMYHGETWRDREDAPEDWEDREEPPHWRGPGDRE